MRIRFSLLTLLLLVLTIGAGMGVYFMPRGWHLERTLPLSGSTDEPLAGIRRLRFSNDGKKLVSYSHEACFAEILVQLVPVDPRQEPKEIKLSLTTEAPQSPDGAYLAYPRTEMLSPTQWQQYLEILDLNTFAVVKSIPITPGLGSQPTAEFSFDSKHVSVYEKTASVYALGEHGWELETPGHEYDIGAAPLFASELNELRVASFGLPSGRSLFVNLYGSVTEFDPQSGKTKTLFEMPKFEGRAQHGILRCVALSPDKTLLAATGRMGIMLWRLADSHLVRTFPIRSAYCVRFSRDGSRLFAFGESEFAEFDTESGETIVSQKFQPGDHAADVSIDETRVLIGTARGAQVFHRSARESRFAFLLRPEPWLLALFSSLLLAQMIKALRGILRERRVHAAAATAANCPGVVAEPSAG